MQPHAIKRPAELSLFREKCFVYLGSDMVQIFLRRRCTLQATAGKARTTRHLLCSDQRRPGAGKPVQNDRAARGAVPDRIGDQCDLPTLLMPA